MNEYLKWALFGSVIFILGTLIYVDYYYYPLTNIYAETYTPFGLQVLNFIKSALTPLTDISMLKNVPVVPIVVLTLAGFLIVKLANIINLKIFPYVSSGRSNFQLIISSSVIVGIGLYAGSFFPSVAHSISVFLTSIIPTGTYAQIAYDAVLGSISGLTAYIVYIKLLRW